MNAPPNRQAPNERNEPQVFPELSRPEIDDPDAVEVSVVLPTYQRPDLLILRALPSALAQTLREIEIIVVIDGPDPATVQALSRVTDPRVRTVQLPSNCGGNGARSAGIQAARGRWVALLDDDDEWLPHKLADQLEVARASNSWPVVVSRWITRTPQADYPNPSRLPDPGEPLGDYMLMRRESRSETNGLVSSVLLAPRALWLEVALDPSLPRHQDWDWLLRAAEHPMFELRFTERIGAIWYYGEDRPSISRKRDWQASLSWAQRHRAAGRMSAGAYAGFLISHVAPAAKASGQPAAGRLLRELLGARPRPFEVARFLAIWVASAQVRRSGRKALQRILPPWGQRGPRPVQAARTPGHSSSVTLIDPLDTGHHASYAAQVARGLVERGYAVTLVGPAGLVGAVREAVPAVQGEVLELCDAGLDHYYRLGRLEREQHNLRFLRRALEGAGARQASVTHLLYLDGFVLSLLGAAWSSPATRLRATLHWAYFAPPFRRPSWRSQLLYRLLLSALRWRGLRVMVHSPLLARVVARAGPLPADVVPYFSASPDLSGAQRACARQRRRRELGYGPDDRVLLAFGGTRRDKGSDLALRALAELPPEYHLLVVGPAREFDAAALRELAQRYGVSDRVQLHLEHIPEDQVETQFVAADLALLPYRRDFAGQSGPLMIAGGLGVPVVASEVGVLAETVRAYDLGRCFPPGDPLALAQAVRSVWTQPPAPATARFLADHHPERFMDAILRSYFGADAEPASQT